MPMTLDRVPRRVVYPAVLALLVVATPAFGAGTHAHVHGHAVLQVAVDGGTLTLALVSPLESLLGFEHAPRTDRQQAAVRRMAQAMHQPDTLFVLPAEAKCGNPKVTLASPVIPPPLLAAQPAPAPAPKAGAKPAPAKGGEHAELEAEFAWTCERPERLTHLEVKLFDAFKTLKRVDARVAAGGRQAAARLTARNPKLTW